jgi:hypothetical protein
MKTLIILVFALTGATCTFAQTSKQKTPSGKSDTSKYLYTCTMHPEVMKEKPGTCPKCGMTLVKKKVDKIYTCTMDPDVVSDKPGNCPKCGMELVEKTSRPSTKK